MKCEEAKELIELFHDGLPDKSLKANLKEHLIVCPSCKNILEQTEALSRLMRRNPLPEVSPALRQGLIDAFKSNYKQLETAPLPFWKRLFSGSISIPKPVLAAAVILMMLGMIGANILGRNSSVSSATVTTSSDSTSVLSVVAPSPQISEQFKTQEAQPVVSERVITKIVYANRPAVSVKPENRVLAGAKKSVNRINTQAKSTISKPDAPNFMNSLVSDKGYFTQANLKDFQPADQMNPRIFKEDGSNEK